MKIGIFDSGVGGLIVTRAIRNAMPQYDYVYLGDTLRVPYGNRSQKVVREFTEDAINYLFEKENCALVILACNTASAQALRYLQKKYPNKKILGVLIPAAEEAAKYSRVGVLATVGTVNSKSFPN
jgi:glutamate racemase